MCVLATWRELQSRFLDLHQKAVDERLGREPLGVTVIRDEILPPNLTFRNGPYNPYLLQVFLQIATDAGMLLGTAPEGTKPSEFWIDRLATYCIEENDWYISRTALKAGDKTPHSFTIDSLCEACATYCAWLDVAAINAQSLGSSGELHRIVSGVVSSHFAEADKPFSQEVVTPRTASEQHRYEAAKVALGTLDQESMTLLRHLDNQGDLTFRGSGPPPLPAGMTAQKALECLDRCLSLDLVKRDLIMKDIGAVYPSPETSFQIAPGMKAALSELLYAKAQPDPDSPRPAILPVHANPAFPELGKVTKLVSVGEQIEALRIECDWTTEFLAEKIGISARSAYRHVSNDDTPSKLNLGKYERVFSEALGKKVLIVTTSEKVRKRQKKS